MTRKLAQSVRLRAGLHAGDRIDRRTELLVGLGNDLNTWLLVEVTDQLSDFVPRLWAVPGDVIQGLGQGHLRRQHFVIATKRGPSEGLVV